MTENESDTDESVDESNLDEDMSESEDQVTFFEHMLKNVENWESLTEKEIIHQLARSTQWFMELKKLAKNDTMLEKIVNKVNKYTQLGLKYDKAMLTVFEKDTAYFNKLITRISEEEE